MKSEIKLGITAIYTNGYNGYLCVEIFAWCVSHISNIEDKIAIIQMTKKG